MKTFYKFKKALSLDAHKIKEGFPINTTSYHLTSESIGLMGGSAFRSTSAVRGRIEILRQPTEDSNLEPTMTAAIVENEKTRQRGGFELGGVPYSETCIRLEAGAMLCTQRSPLCSLCISIQRVTFFAGQRAARYSAFPARLLST